MTELPPTTGLMPAAVASAWMFLAHVVGRNSGALSSWRVMAGFCTVVWHVSLCVYTFGFLGYFIRVADQPLPGWLLQVVMVTAVLCATWIVVRYLVAYVGDGMSWGEAAMVAFSTESGVQREDEE